MSSESDQTSRLPEDFLASGDVAADEAHSNPDLNGDVSTGHALLVIQRGPRAGERFLLDTDRTLAGRHSAADIVLDDVTVSRKHAEFLTHEGGYMVRDVGSLNGTYVNGDRVDSATLRAGDQVQIGKYRLAYQPATHEDAEEAL